MARLGSFVPMTDRAFFFGIPLESSARATPAVRVQFRMLVTQPPLLVDKNWAPYREKDRREVRSRSRPQKTTTSCFKAGELHLFLASGGQITSACFAVLRPAGFPLEVKSRGSFNEISRDESISALLRFSHLLDLFDDAPPCDPMPSFYQVAVTLCFFAHCYRAPRPPSYPSAQLTGLSESRLITHFPPAGDTGPFKRLA